MTPQPDLTVADLTESAIRTTSGGRANLPEAKIVGGRLEYLPSLESKFAAWIDVQRAAERLLGLDADGASMTLEQARIYHAIVSPATAAWDAAANAEIDARIATAQMES